MATNSALPLVSGTQMAAVDAAMADVCGLELVQVMEIAGRAVAIAARQMLRASPVSGTVAILCGSGGNGGDGLVCGRYLAGWGFGVDHWLVRPSAEYRGLAGHQLEIARKTGQVIREPEMPADFGGTGLIVDGLFGFGLNAAPSGRAAELIQAANQASAQVLAIDIPSGVDSTTGEAWDPSIRAGVTVTLGLPKIGLVQRAGPAHVGEVIVADIGIPAAAYRAAGIPLTDAFHNAEFVLLDGSPYRIGL